MGLRQGPTEIFSALALFASVLLHELGHSVVAQRNGIAIRGITLHIFGGVAKLAREADSPGVEFRVAAAGPAVSFALALAGDVLLRLAAWPAPAAALLAYLSFVNGLLGGFNLVPGFPLDGGRMLRALLWWWKGDLQQATRVTGAIGGGFAYTLMLLGVASFSIKSLVFLLCLHATALDAATLPLRPAYETALERTIPNRSSQRSGKLGCALFCLCLSKAATSRRIPNKSPLIRKHPHGATAPSDPFANHLSAQTSYPPAVSGRQKSVTH